MITPLLLYSASTWLAYSIAERFYGVHYVWCTPFYDGLTAPRYVNVPPTSSPAELYRNMEEETRRGDLHSDRIRRNVNGILDGAAAKLQAGAITKAQYRRSRKSSRTPRSRTSGPFCTLSRSISWKAESLKCPFPGEPTRSPSNISLRICAAGVSMSSS